MTNIAKSFDRRKKSMNGQGEWEQCVSLDSSFAFREIKTMGLSRQLGRCVPISIFLFQTQSAWFFIIIITLEINIARHMRNRWEPGKEMGMRQLENCLVPAGQ